MKMLVPVAAETLVVPYDDTDTENSSDGPGERQSRPELSPSTFSRADLSWRFTSGYNMGRNGSIQGTIT